MNRPDPKVRHKHFRLNSSKIARAQKLLRAGTETETIEMALDFLLTEHRRNQLAWQGTERFLQSGIEIKDAYGKLKE